MNHENSFDRLVSELGKDERLTLLQKLSSVSVSTPEANEAPDILEKQ